MNIRIKKKKAKPIIDICKKVKYRNGDLLWDLDVIYFSDVLFGKEAIEDYNNAWYILHQIRKDLFLIVKKAFKDSFPIQEYLLREYHYEDNLTVYSFSNIREYAEMQKKLSLMTEEQFINSYCKNINDIKISGIDFVIEHNTKKVIPYRYDEITTTRPNMFPCDNCFDAVYVEHV